MKIIFAVLVALSFGSAYADTCKLDYPVPVGATSLIEKEPSFRGAKFDQTPRWTDPSVYDASKDKISVALINIHSNNVAMGFLGVQVWIEGKLVNVGFSNVYDGNLNIQGGTHTSGNTTTYTAKNVSDYTEAQHAKNDAITESTVVVENGNLVSVQLTFPVFKVWKKEGTTDFIAFTGEHQTLCLKSVE